MYGHLKEYCPNRIDLYFHNVGGAILEDVMRILCLDCRDRREEAFKALAVWHRDGKVQYRFDVIEGLKNAPRAMSKLFDGSNNGKLILKL